MSGSTPAASTNTTLAITGHSRLLAKDRHSHLRHRSGWRVGLVVLCEYTYSQRQAMADEQRGLRLKLQRSGWFDGRRVDGSQFEDERGDLAWHIKTWHLRTSRHAVIASNRGLWVFRWTPSDPRERGPGTRPTPW